MNHSQMEQLRALAEKDPEFKKAVLAIGKLTADLGTALAPILTAFAKEHPKLPVDMVMGSVAAYVGGMAFGSGANLETIKASLEGGFLAGKMKAGG